MRFLIPVVVLAVALGGCGSSPSDAGTQATQTQAATAGTSVNASGGSHLTSACSSRARRVLLRYGAVKPSPFTASNGAESCHFRSSGGEPDVVAELDGAPQPYFRMEREQVEFWQNVEWSHKTAGASPRPVKHLGLGGYWFPLQRRLLTTDGVRLITIKVRSAGTSGAAARKALAARLARVYLGPPVKPPGY